VTGEWMRITDGSSPGRSLFLHTDTARVSLVEPPQIAGTVTEADNIRFRCLLCLATAHDRTAQQLKTDFGTTSVTYGCKHHDRESGLTAIRSCFATTDMYVMEQISKKLQYTACSARIRGCQ
jgi:hypothetical protein